VTRDSRIRTDDRRRPGPTPEAESPRTVDRRFATSRSDRRHAAASPRPRVLPILVPLLVLAVAIAGIVLMAPRSKPAASPAAAWTAVATQTAPAPTAEATPTPAFASFRGVQIHLPIAPANITVILFHPTSYKNSYPMKPLVALRSPSRAKATETAAKRAGTRAVEPTSGPVATDDGVWTGWAVQTWRADHGGKLDSALDCGAKPGTTVIAPVSGTVMEIRPYKLYGRVDDFEFNIKPDAWSDVDVIVLHVTDPSVKIGDHILGGLTPIASVRNLTSKLTGISLGSYTSEGGNHTHVQLNKIIKPNETWLVGEDPPGLKRKGE